MTTFRRHPRTPCENCPYRVDAPRRHWARAEFVEVLEGEADPLGKVWGCHKQASLPESERGICAGFLLDQVRRGLPSIKLRIALARDPAGFIVNLVSDGGATMFKTVKAMCRANGVRPKPKGIA